MEDFRIYPQHRSQGQILPDPRGAPHLLSLADHLPHHLLDVGLPLDGWLHVDGGTGDATVGDGLGPAEVQLGDGAVGSLGPVLQRGGHVLILPLAVSIAFALPRAAAVARDVL